MTTRFLPLTPGDPTEVAGYVLHARLGSGGMGTVYLSFSRGGRPVAIKLVRQDLADDPEFRRRFAREISAAKQVQGHYTAPVVDADPDAPVPWFATGYIAGPSLQSAVAEHGPFPLFAVFRLLAGAAEGIAAVHAAGMIHRDLKPANVLLAEDGPRVIDFGIAYAANSSELTGKDGTVGTPAYMAPEQISGRVGPATDVFGLGQLALYAAAGHGAFGEGPAQSLLYRIINEPPYLDDCPYQLRPVVESCLAKNPANRPPVTWVMDYARNAMGDDTMRVLNEPWLPPSVAATLMGYAPGTAPTASPSRPPSRTVSAAPAPATVAVAPPRRRWLSRLAVITSIVLILRASGYVGDRIGESGKHLEAAGSTQDPGASAADGSALPAATGSGYSEELGITFFPMPTVCHGTQTQDDPSNVTFGTAGGFSRGTGNKLGVDLLIDCSGAPGGDLNFGGNHALHVSGNPTAASCQQKAGNASILPEIPVSELKEGEQFCMTVNSDEQVILLTVLRVGSADLALSATVWSVP